MVGIAGMVLTERLGISGGDVRGVVLKGGGTRPPPSPYICCRDSIMDHPVCTATNNLGTQCTDQGLTDGAPSSDATCNNTCVHADICVINGTICGVGMPFPCCSGFCDQTGPKMGQCKNKPPSLTPASGTTPPPPPSPTKCNQETNCKKKYNGGCVQGCHYGKCRKWQEYTTASCSFNPPNSEFGICNRYGPKWQEC